MSFLLLVALVLLALGASAHDVSRNLRREHDFRVLEDPEIVQRCKGEKLTEAQDPLAELRAPGGGNMKAFEQIVYIPVVFHVCRLQNGRTGDVPLTNLLLGLESLNQAYAGLDVGGVTRDSNFRFFLQGVIYWDNNDYFLNCEGLDNTMKAQSAFKQESVLNVYTCRMTVLGFAYLPFTPVRQHGVVVSFNTFPFSDKERYYAPYRDYRLGYTLVHEIGHALGLLHTFDGGCGGQDASDTAAEATPYFGGCDALNPDASNIDTCPGSPGLDPINNFMDYSLDSCMRVFTAGQINRMQQQVAQYKPAMANMAHSLTCYTTGLVGTAHKYGLCNSVFPSNLTTPDGNPAPEGGWCIIQGFQVDPITLAPVVHWGQACCPGSCSDFDEIAPLFPPLGSVKPKATKAPTVPPKPVAMLDPRTCNRAARWDAANTACKRRKMRVCTTNDFRDGALVEAVQRVPKCAGLLKRYVWSGLLCSSSSAVSVNGTTGLDELCDSRRKAYPYACCQDQVIPRTG